MLNGFKISIMLTDLLGVNVAMKKLSLSTTQSKL